MATLIQYQLKPAYASTYAGGVIYVDSNRAFDVGAALTAGSGTITVDSSDLALVNALNGDWALQKTGTTTGPGSGIPITLQRDVIVQMTNPQTGDLVVYNAISDTFVNSPAGNTASAAPAISTLGTLAATVTLSVATEAIRWATATLATDTTLTISGMNTGQTVILHVAQGAGGAWTLQLTLGSTTVAVPTNQGVGQSTLVTVRYDGTDYWVEGA